MKSQYSNMKNQVIRSISQNRLNRNVLNNKYTAFKQRRDREIENYNETKWMNSRELERLILLEKSNMVLLEYQQKIKACDMFLQRVQPFMDCVVAVESGNEERIKESFAKFAEEIRNQALECKKMEIQDSKQRRIVYSRTRQWLKSLEKEDYNKWKLQSKRESTNANFSNESLKLLELGEEERSLSGDYTNKDIKLKREDFYDTKLLMESPLITINEIYPDVKATSVKADGKKDAM